MTKSAIVCAVTVAALVLGVPTALFLIGHGEAGQPGDLEEADLLVVVGDIDNLGFGWPPGFDVFSGNSTPAHSYPWKPGVNDPPGTDRITVGTGYNGHPPAGQDGYTGSTSRPENLPQPIELKYDLRGIQVRSAALQMFVDDFQSPVWKGQIQAKLNDQRAPFLETVLNALNQTGPVGKLVTVQVPPEFLPMVASGRVTISIDDPATGAGDGFAVDFVRLLVNPHSTKYAGRVTGKVTDAVSGRPLVGAAVSAAGTVNVMTQRDGTYLLGNVPAGLAVVTAANCGYGSQTLSADLVAGSAANLNFALVPSPNTVTIQVPANKAWTGTGTQLTQGTEVQIMASGTVDASSPSDARAYYHQVPPEGRMERLRQFPFPLLPGLTLLGRVGNGPSFLVGAGAQFTVDPAYGSGELQLGINDDIVADNSGAWTAKVTILRGGAGCPRVDAPVTGTGRAYTAQPRASGHPMIASVSQFSWVGQDADYVGEWGNGHPDGRKDGHFRLILSLPSATDVRSIAVYSADAGGTPQGGQVWHSASPNYWMLGVFQNGRQLNQTHVPTLGGFPGETTLDLYCNDSGWFKSGNYFLVEIELGNGQKLRQVAQLTPGPATGRSYTAQPRASGAPPPSAEILEIPNTRPEKLLSRTLLEAGRDYLLEVSGTFDDWGNTPHGIDAVWCFAEWRCGRQGQAWDQLRIDGKGLTEIAGRPIPYNSQHVYQVHLKGQGKPVELYLSDAQGSWSDNLGSVTVRISPAD